ncbi:hypothetical protein [uncultured Rikenella sp.]|uniref:hypothetical protein n=1 Tax=uncultured Rikenella sp. TaxID=368003 RepID=UPI002605DDBD|nr:hypothetical protein [uncultured Rikenella sp.]
MKKKAPKGWVKISDFEELTGISSKTIAAAIKRGYIPDQVADRVGTGATSPYLLDPQQAAKSWYSSLNAAHPASRKIRQTLADYIKTFDSAFIAPEKKHVENPAALALTYEDAQLQEKIAKARLAELELAEKEGSLVAKATIDAELFAAAQEIRNALLVIPDRIVDQVIAEAANRNKAHSVIYNAIADELEKLADIGARLEK